MNEPKYQTEKFYGTVIVKEWMPTLGNKQVQRITGLLTLVQDVDIAGFKTRGTEANWGMRIEGTSEQWTILGCQIRAVIAHPEIRTQSPDSAHIVT